MNKQEEAHLEFKKKSLILISIRKYGDKLYNEGKINKKNKKALERRLLYEWDRVWNKHPYVPSSIKQSFNLLYS